MQISIDGSLSEYDKQDIRVEVAYDYYDQALSDAKAEEIINSLADKVARKLIAARVA